MKMKKLLTAALCVAVLLAVTIVPAYASTDNTIVRAGAQWMLDGLFWIGVCVVVFVLVQYVLKRNITGIIITVVLGAVILVIIKNPDILTSLGEMIRGVLGVGSSS